MYTNFHKPAVLLPKVCLALVDFLALQASVAIGILGLVWYGDYFGHWDLFETWAQETGMAQIAISLFFSGLILVAFWFQGLYWRRLPFWDELLSILRIVSFLFVCHGALVLAAKWPLSRFVWLASWLLSLVLIPYFRSLARKILTHLGLWKKPTFILGSGGNALSAFTALQSEAAMGFEVEGFLEIPSQKQTDVDMPQHLIKISVPPSHVVEELRQRGYPHLVLALETDGIQKEASLIQQLSVQYPSFSWIPDVQGMPLFGMEVSHFFSHEVLLLTVRNNLANPFARFLKRSLDLVGSTLLLIVLSPLFLYLSYQIRKTKGPAIFTHERVGRNGKAFRVYKFRTMIPDAEKVLAELLSSNPQAQLEWNKEFKLKDDPRITSIGHFLRQSSLDELPQLWNVFKGEMSLVGPRPVTAEELEKYQSKVVYYLATRPGLTGLWQVSGRNDVSYETRTSLDAWYIKNWNLWYDIAILFKTIGVVLRRKGAY
jgi:Undecaprenyl-phosphate galactose phosphotransferase WbaP